MLLTSLIGKVMMSKLTCKGPCVSRDGLTTCPSCGAHIRIADTVSETACPFCDTAHPTLSQFTHIKRGVAGLLVASLITLAPACGDSAVYGAPTPPEDAWQGDADPADGKQAAQAKPKPQSL